MSCQINVVSSICDVREIRKKLFPNWTDTLEVKPDGDWSNVGWTLNDEGAVEDDSKDELSYFQQCHVALSPVGDVMVIAHTRIATFLTLKYDNTLQGDNKEKFVCSATEVLTDDEEDHVTCIICLPLAALQTSLRGRHDWTAIIMGFSSGQVKIYTENGIPLISQKFHEEAVTKIKCRTFENPRLRALAEQQEELVILYKKAVVTVDGFSLYQTLRACRNQAAKATASGSDIIEAPPVAYKKWGFHATDVIDDCESIGIAYSNLFDNMMYESISRGFHGYSRSVFPTASLFITTGQAPYLSFFYAVEGSAPSLMMDVAMAAAHKLKSLITGLFGRSNRAPADKKPPKIEPSTPLPSRFEIRDFTRLGLRISTSPNRRLSVVTDDFGRVILIDNYEGISIRIWKGYRDAQCGWIEAEEDSRQIPENRTGGAVRRSALFLAIYCPRRGILEIWTMQQGPRVAAFNVSKSASLVSCTHGILGLANVKSVIDGRSQTHYCYLVDADGQVKTISVPFHYALSARHSKRARDLHLLKKLKALLKDCEGAEDKLASETSAILLGIKTANVRQEALEALIHHKNSSLPVLKVSINRLVDSLQCQGPDALDLESKLLLHSCVRQQQLLHIYEEVLLLRKNSISRQRQEVLDDRKPSQVLSAMFHLCEAEVQLLLGNVDKLLASNQPTKCVRFEDAKTLVPGRFLSSFQTFCSHLPRLATPVVQASGAGSSSEEFGCLEIHLVPHLSTDRVKDLARLLFQSAVEGNCCSTDLEGILVQSGIDKKELLILVIEFWLQMEKGHSDYHCLRSCYNIVKFLSSISDANEVVAKYNELSPWWTSFRNILSSSAAPAATFTAALICRGVAVTLATAHQAKAMENVAVLDSEKEEKKMEESDNLKMDVVKLEDSEAGSAMDVSISDWEDVDLDTETWSLLVKQLEDLVVLSTLLTHKIPSSLCSKSLYTLPENSPIAVSCLSEKGRGVITELVAIWLTRLNISSILQLTAHVSVDKSEDVPASSSDNIETGRIAIAERVQLNIDELKELFESTRGHFPRSLQQDVLLANCCREFGALWNKDKDDVNNLHNAVVCLEQISVSPWGKGLASYLWHTFIKDTFRSAALLMEKVGKVPKERLCRKELNMSDVSLEKFVASCVKLLDVLIKVCYSRDSQGVMPFQCEEPWQNTSGPQPLVDLVSSQRDPGYDLVCHHYKLALSMLMVLTYGLKSSRPIGMYDPKSKSMFFKDLHSGGQIPENTQEQAIISSRTQFLCKVITAAVLSLPEPTFGFSDGLALSSPESASARHWIGKVMQLASLWNLDNDCLWRHYVCELYNSGLDSLAEEILSFVSDREVMGSQLILLVGQRIFSAVNASNEDYVQKMSMFPPTVTTWLNTLNQNLLRCSNPPLDLTVCMIAYIINAIPEDQAVHKMALSLLEPLNHMISSSKSVKEESS